jgi:RNA polymerase sigma factor (sigma-70 family)
VIHAAVDEPNDSLETNDAAVLIGRAIDRLPENEAKLLDEFHFQRRKVAQLAESYGISERAIEGRLRRARERLRRELESIQPRGETG